MKPVIMLRVVYPTFRRLANLAVLALTCALNLGTTVMPLEFERLVDLAESVVRATVVNTRCEWRTEEGSRFIVTVVTLRVDEVVLGPAVETLELEFLGGRLDGRTLTVEGQPEFHVGDEDILFVTGNGRSFCPLVGMTYGRILVVPDDQGQRLVARSNGAPIRALAELETPISDARAAIQRGGIPPAAAAGSRGMTADDFCSAIRNRALRLGRTDVVYQ